MTPAVHSSSQLARRTWPLIRHRMLCASVVPRALIGHACDAGREKGMTPLNRDEPRISGTVAGPRSAAWLERDHRVMSPSYTRVYPLVVRRARGAMIEDMDGNRFLDFTAGIAVTNVGPFASPGRRGDPPAGEPLDPHVGDRFLLCAAGPAGGAAGRAGARAGAEAGLLHQQRRRGDRGRLEAGAAAHGPQPRAWRS